MTKEIFRQVFVIRRYFAVFLFVIGTGMDYIDETFSFQFQELVRRLCLWRDLMVSAINCFIFLIFYSHCVSFHILKLPYIPKVLYGFLWMKSLTKY